MTQPMDAATGASSSFNAMGTLVRVQWGPASLALEYLLRDRMAHLEALLSHFRLASEISQLDDQWRPIAADTEAVLAASAELAAQTGGWFSPTLGHRTAAWRQVAAGQKAVSQLLESGRAGQVWAKSGWARLSDGLAPGSVDLGAIAKGYAADQLRDLAINQGASWVLVSVGGSSVAVAGRSVNVGLASPWQGLESFGVLELAAGALSVSADPGTLMGSGRRTSHVLDPHTGFPARTDLCAVTVCAEDGMVAEAYSTAYLAMGLDAALQLDLTRPELSSIFMTVDGRVLASPKLSIKAMPGVLGWLAESRRACYLD